MLKLSSNKKKRVVLGMGFVLMYTPDNYWLCNGHSPMFILSNLCVGVFLDSQN